MERYLLEEALNNAHNGVIVIDKETQITYCNDAACKLLGISRDDTINKKIKEVVPRTEMDQVVKDGMPRLNRQVELENRVIISNRTPLKKNGEIVGAVAVFQDITELREAIQELTITKDLLDKLETSLEHLSEGIIMVDKNGYITNITDSYCDFLKIDKNHVIGKHVTEVIKNTRMHKVLETGKAEIGDIQKINGKDVIVMRIPIKSDNKIIGAVGQVMFQDVSELARLASKLNVVEKKLEYYQQEYKKWQKSKYNINHIIGNSSEIKKLKSMINKVAQYPSTVLIRGESGTGKELIAHAIHEAGPRSESALVRVNCAAIPKELLEAELFGYEEGSFTGAKKKGKPGKFELAEGGTIFLDEIGDMPQEMQVKLLRVLQEKEVDRVGGTEIISINTRVIASTNRDLEAMLEQGSFRYDLFYRLNVVTLRLPPLREMRDDILEISSYILNQLNEELGTEIKSISGQVKELFMNYPWPGNVRELRNVLERAVNVMEGPEIELKDLPLYLQEFSISQEEHKKEQVVYSLLTKELETAEKKVISKALKISGNNKREAAKLLNIHRATLYRKIQKYGIQA